MLDDSKEGVSYNSDMDAATVLVREDNSLAVQVAMCCLAGRKESGMDHLMRILGPSSQLHVSSASTWAISSSLTGGGIKVGGGEEEEEDWR